MKLAVDRLLVPAMIRDMSAKHDDDREVGDQEEDEEIEGKLEEDVMKTNAFGSTVAEISTRALFPLISVRFISSPEGRRPPSTCTDDNN